MCCIQQLMVLESELVRLSKENEALKNELNQVKETNHNMQQQLLGAQTQPATLSNALKKVYIIATWSLCLIPLSKSTIMHFQWQRNLKSISGRPCYKKLCYKSGLSPCSLVDNELGPLVLTVHILNRLYKVRCCSLDTCLKVSWQICFHGRVRTPGNVQKWL